MRISRISFKAAKAPSRPGGQRQSRPGGMGGAVKRKTWLMIAAIALTSLAATHLLGTFRFFQLMHLKAQDVQFVLRGALPTEPIVLIVIDDKSLEHFSELQLLWHPYYAEAIQAAAGAGAKVLGLDVAFGIPVTKWEPNHDQLMAEAVSITAATMPVVCGYVPSMMAKQKEWPVPVNMIAAALGQSAFANLTVDPDDFVRNQELIEAPQPGSNEPLARALAMRVAEKFLGEDAAFDDQGRLMLAGKPIPVSTMRTVAVNFAGPPGTFPRYSLSDFIEAARAGRTDQLREWVGGKAVLLGPDNISDRHATPFYTLFSGPRWNTAGVEIHASTLRTLLSREFLVPVPPPLRLLAIFVVGAVTSLIVVSVAVKPAALLLAGSIASTAAISHWLFRSGWLISASELLLACLLSVLVSMVYRFFTAEKRGDMFRSAVSVFVGQRLATTLEETQTIALSGTRQIVTILFSDIRGFTSFCEEKDPAVVVGLLNRYMGDMVRVIVSHHGQVNKFLGDGILAIFSDEDGTEAGDHPRRAVACGIEMSRVPGEFKTGVGIHTGPAVVGNVGSADKMEYTVLGDTVNLASRLESLNKEYKTQLLLSEATKSELKTDIETIFLGGVQVRGKTIPMNLYTVAGLYTAPLKEVAVASGEKSS
ncbi:MAG: adenylate/guanylate cyclase domain-containing protein [Bryobacteraceae bacterium]